MFDLTGRTALVTGAGQGMGVGLARALSGQGAAVAVNDLFPDRAEATAAAITAEGGTAVAVPFDVTDLGAVATAISQIDSELGSVDILVNNAGIPESTKTTGQSLFRETDPEAWRPYIDLNIYGSLNCIYTVVEPMVERGWGRVIQISSGAGRRGYAFGNGIYGASKSGIEGFIRHFAHQLGATGVTANALAFGLMSNAPVRAGDPALENLRKSIPVGRLGTPEDAGAFCVFLASTEAGYVHGQTFNLNGGQFSN